jgi:uncharacterized membrane protein
VANLNLMGTNRLESFSDGVMAVAITLLVLNIGVPEIHSGQSLAHALGQQWDQYVAYAVSFMTIGIIWINHHAMISRLREADHTILMLNLVLLMTIGLLPFATDLLATYLRRPEGHAIAAAVYSGTFLLMSLAFSAVNRHILLRKAELMVKTLPGAQRRRILQLATVGVVPYAIATGLAFLSSYAALAICAAMALLYATPLTTGVRAGGGPATRSE